MPKNLLRKIVLFYPAIILAGCAYVNPISKDERDKQAISDLNIIEYNQEEIIGPVTMQQAIARALKYNLERKVKIVEEELADAQATAAKFELLPQMSGSATFAQRSNQGGSRSRSLTTYDDSSDPSTSQEKAHLTSLLTASWNLVDFGVSYIRAKQQEDQNLVAKEKRRRAVHSLIQDTRQAYWRAVAAESLKADLEILQSKLKSGLSNAKKIEEQRLQPPLQILEYQKSLLDLQKQLQGVLKDLAQAKAELASLMGTTPSRNFQIQLPKDFDLKFLYLPTDSNQLSHFALRNRPELYAEDYQVRIAEAEATKAMLRLLPGLELSGTYNTDTNRYMHYHHWAEAGVKVTWNLLNLISGPSNLNIAEGRENLANAKRLALTMAIMTQTQVAYRRLLQTVDEYDNASAIALVDQKMFEHAEAAGQAANSSELDLIKKEATKIFSKAKKAQNYAELRAAEGAMRLSLGLELTPEAPSEGLDIASLVGEIDAIDRWPQLAEIRLKPYGDQSDRDVARPQWVIEK